MDWTRCIDPDGLQTWVVRYREEEMRRAAASRLAREGRTSRWSRAVQFLRLSLTPVERAAQPDP